MTDLDKEAKRLAAAHPWAGTATETHRTDWQPQHAVPRRPAPYRPTDETIELQVAADLARIDRELDPQAPPAWTRNWYASPQHWNYVFHTSVRFDQNLGAQMHDDFDTIDATQWNAIRRHAEKLARLDATYGFGTSSFRLDEDEADRYRTLKQRKPKTYVAPGRKAGRTWIARLEQSKQSKRKPK